MNKALIAGLVLVLVLAAGAVYFYNQPEVVSENLVIEGDYDAPNLLLKDGAMLTVNGNLLIEKAISCEGGPISITVTGDANITGSLRCKEGESAGIALVVAGDVTFGKDAKVYSVGNVQIVRDAADLLTDEDALEAAYQEAGQPTGAGPRFGPFVENGSVSSLSSSNVVAFMPAPENGIIAVARAEEATDKDGNVIPDAVIGGNWVIGQGGTPPSGVMVPAPDKKIKRIILNFDFGADGNVVVRNFHLIGPAGEDGTSDEAANCSAKGTDGKDAMRFRVKAASVDIDSFRIELGNGGAGGTAETTKECEHGIAKGGNGGEAGNMKITAENGITIRSMEIIPGGGGHGGGATAYGKNGINACPGEKGGDATATGGNGGKNKKELSASGGVSGIENVYIAEVLGGIGGSAYAYAGTGGNGTGCNCAGGAGGKATATGGKGGDASVKTEGVGNAGAVGGDGGEAESVAGSGGAGGMCPLKPSGGNGGKGGDASAKGGNGGTGTTEAGEDGSVNDEKGGNGGNGGEGCGPGEGGKGGAGATPGVDGAKGALKCPAEEAKTEVQVGGGGATDTGKKTIKVIRYQGKYLPVDQLIVEDEVGCGADHWHAATGLVIATDGSNVIDPGPQCGYGKVKDVPAMDYAPN